MVNGQVKIASK